MNKHTSGPWRTRLIGMQYVVETMSGSHLTAYVLREADARLIAAAPELLAACETVWSRLGEMCICLDEQAILEAAVQKAKVG